MKVWQKTLLLVGIAGLGLTLISASSAYEKYKKFFDKMTYFVDKIKNVRISGGKLKFSLDILLKNNTHHSLNVSTLGIAVLKSVTVTDKSGTVLGNVNRHFDSFQVSEYGLIPITDIAFEIPILELLKHLSNQNFNNFSADDIVNQLNFILNFELAGKPMSYKLTF